MSGRILVVDDEKDMLLLLERIITAETQYEVVTFSNPLQALDAFRVEPFDVVITDLKMPKMDGMRLLEEVKKINPEVSVIILTAFATIDNAVEAIHKGAYDYLTKPFRRERILITIEKLMEWQRIVRENQELRRALQDTESSMSMIGSSSVMQDLMDQIQRVAPTNATVLIIGASGTGKELAAREVYQRSKRKDKRLVIVNCTSIPENVLESEFFWAC